MKKKKVSNFFKCLFNSRKKKIVFGIGILLFSLLITTTLSANISPENEVKSVEIESIGWKTQEPGSWHIDKSAKWTGYATAQIKFDVDTVLKAEKTNDIVLILDVSGSMQGDKLSKVKEDTIELIGTILSNNENNIALISFATNAEILSEFTNDKDELISIVNNLKASGSTNYADALRKTNSLLENYEKKLNKELVALFMSDGYPCEETPNQIGEYAILKDNYPYLTVNAIQYEMGSEIINQLIQISDHQYSAYLDNLENVLFEASAIGAVYESFIITDYIDTDNFIVDSEKNISVSRGTFEFDYETQKITWHLGKLDEEKNTATFSTGRSATMTIYVTLKEEHRNKKGLYETNTKEEINSKVLGEEEQEISSNVTPVLYNGYDVIYDTNPPTGCNIKNIETETHIFLDLVTIRNDEPVCEGYQFKGWQISEEDETDITKVNGSQFKMPLHDVHIRATWSKLDIKKSMAGSIYEPTTLLKEITTKNTWILDDNLDFSDYKEAGTAGYYIRNGTQDLSNPIYYYRGAVTDNNVVFAEMCWKIVRTTETGGIKLVYNGPVVDNNGRSTCPNTTEDDTQIKTQFSSYYNASPFNGSEDLAAYVGYMFNTNVKEATSDDMVSAGLTSEDVNTTDSSIKKEVDAWFKTNMTNEEDNTKKDYSIYLENAVWCNDRSFGSQLDSDIYFGSYNRYLAQKAPGSIDAFYLTDDDACPNIIDRFTVKNLNGQGDGGGNGALTYPVGLLTADEVALAGLGGEIYDEDGNQLGSVYNEKSWLNNGAEFWTMSPSFNTSDYSSVFQVYNNEGNGLSINGLHTFSVVSPFGIRPVVSLESKTIIYGGDGSVDNPYLVD